MPDHLTDPLIASRGDYFRSDEQFNVLYPPAIRKLSGLHWTPLRIAKETMDFLGNEDCRVLDIGSGVGKFCLSAAHYAPNVMFTGVEQRQYLVHHAQKAQKELQIGNVTFVNANFTDIDLLAYDHFYFFNSFFEHLHEDGRIDNHIEHSEAMYDYYVNSLYEALATTPPGTKLVTYHSLPGELPKGFELVRTSEKGDLRFWSKV